MLISDGRRHLANVQEKLTFIVGCSLRLYSRGTLLNSSSFSRWMRDLEAFDFAFDFASYFHVYLNIYVLLDVFM